MALKQTEDKVWTHFRRDDKDGIAARCNECQMLITQRWLCKQYDQTFGMAPHWPQEVQCVQVQGESDG